MHYHRQSFLYALCLAIVMMLSACSSTAQNGQTSNPSAHKHEKKSQQELDKMHRAYFASGCFWCVEAVFESVEGVAEAVSGYSGGNTQNPTYESIGTGRTGHAETVEIYYDSSKIDFPTLLKVFFGSQDPTTLNRQGPDRGTQYRSIAFYQNLAEQEMIEKYIGELDASGEYKTPIVTEIKAFEKFWMAEKYHQDYERLHPNQAYIQGVSIPRLKRFQAKFPELLKQH